MKSMIQIIISMFVLLLLSGCTQKASDISSTLSEAFWGFDDINLSKESVEKIPYASSYFRINHGQQIFMVLAFVEENAINKNIRLKWLSSDNSMIVTENGRVVKTLNLPDVNLAEIRSTNPQNHFDESHYLWTAIYSWQPGYQFNFQAKIETKILKEETLVSLIWKENVVQWQEKIVFEGLKKSMHSTYWTDKNGQVLKSAQWVVPDKLFIEQEVLKPYKG